MNKEKPGLRESNGSTTMPCISVIVPYQPKLKKKNVLDDLLTMQANMEEKELLNNFPPEMVSLVIKKFRTMIATIDCPPNGKTIGIFVSPFAEKVYYFSPSHLEEFKLPYNIHKN